MNPEGNRVEQFTFFVSYYEACSFVKGGKNRLKLYDSIMNYMFKGIEPKFTDKEWGLSASWRAILPNLNNSKKNGKNGSREKPNLKASLSGNKNACKTNPEQIENQSIEKNKEENKENEKENKKEEESKGDSDDSSEDEALSSDYYNFFEFLDLKPNQRRLKFMRKFKLVVGAHIDEDYIERFAESLNKFFDFVTLYDPETKRMSFEKYPNNWYPVWYKVKNWLMSDNNIVIYNYERWTDILH